MTEEEADTIYIVIGTAILVGGIHLLACAYARHNGMLPRDALAFSFYPHTDPGGITVAGRFLAGLDICALWSSGSRVVSPLLRQRK